jgi:hypothetical protein
LYGTGATLYGSDNLTAWDSAEDSDEKVLITPRVKGLEETAVLALISPSEGAPLISGIGDINGFVHSDLEAVPESMLPLATTGLDFAAQVPLTIAAAGVKDGKSALMLSTDGGENWEFAEVPADGSALGRPALSADGKTLLWSTDSVTTYRSVDSGLSWDSVSSLPEGAEIVADSTDAKLFYALAGGTLYTSDDNGETFSAAATGLPSGRLKAAPGQSGHLWLAVPFGGGLWHSSDGGASFDTVEYVSNAVNIGFGRAATGADYPALYLLGTVDDVAGLFRSDDAGASWVRINDDDHQYGNAGYALTGDPRVYGRVYLGTNGRGIIVGGLAGL